LQIRNTLFQLKTELNKILTDIGLQSGKIRLISKLRNGGALLEMDLDIATTWLADQENRNKLCKKIGPGVVFRTRVHIVFWSPVRSGFFPFWARTATATGCLIFMKCKKPDRTAHNRLCTVRSCIINRF
jgi:hypothetical protein